VLIWRDDPAQNEGQNMSEAGPAIDPIHQFHIKTITSLHPFGLDASFTNASLFMVIVLLGASYLMILGTSERQIVPNRMQAIAEMSYEFIASTVRQTAGDAGMRFFPFVFSLFIFVLLSNIIGLFPYTFTVTSQIVVTFAFAAFIIGLVILYGIYKNGLHFFHLFVPSGVTPALLPFIVLIEIISFASRPISLSVRLFANMLAGHITLKVFGGFVVMLLGAGAYALLAPLPFVFIIVLTAFELLVAVLQAYVFAILTCVYLNDAIHPGH
jgi:F-type H+-transporting ATPase subunit a